MSVLPFITIGIPFYNADKFLDASIKSVLAQTYQNWELILINDGSSDSSVEIAKKYISMDSRIRLIDDGLNKKLPSRLNQIIVEAKYDFIARMDADDLIAIDRLEKQINFLLENPTYDLVTTGIYSIDEKNHITGKRILKNYQMSPTEMINGATNLIHASLLAKKSWCIRNKYREDNLLAEDFELWLSANIKNDLNYYVIEEPLYFYREGENVTKSKILRAYKSQTDVIEKYANNIISKRKKSHIYINFWLKKHIVILLSAISFLWILEIKRVKSVSDKEKIEFSEHINKIFAY